MRMPRRTAWASQAELAELYDMIYAPHADDQSRQKALSRMSVYLASPSCPSFIHLLHSLLSADLLPTMGAAEIQSTRLSCAMAIVRFINGMVDPLQTGPYARPISHIAASLKIPQSLISLRHRATHEDLPPLPLLKQAVHSAIEYINHYSFLPSLASSSSEPIPRSIRAENLVGRWKKLMKARSRGEVGATDSEREEKTLIREFEGEDMVEITEALAAVGGLIPLAKRKRSSVQFGEPTKASLQIWSPLIKHLASRDSQFIGSLTEQLSAIVISKSTDKKDVEKSSIRWSAAVWLLWLWSERTDSPYPDYETKNHVRRDVLAALINRDEIMARFSEELADIDPLFQKATSGLEDVLDDEESAEDGVLAGLELAEEPTHNTRMDVDGDDMLAQMQARLARLSSRKTGIVPEASEQPTTANHSHTDRPDKSWKRLDYTSWKPCPIGAWGSAPTPRILT